MINDVIYALHILIGISAFFNKQLQVFIIMYCNLDSLLIKAHRLLPKNLVAVICKLRLEGNVQNLYTNPST